MSLISIYGARLAFGDAPLLDNCDLHIEEHERLCLVGRNGAGKSTLMKVISQEQPLDDGRVVCQKDLVVARLQQDPPRDKTCSVYDYVTEGVEQQAAILKKWHALSQAMMVNPDEHNLDEMARLQHILDHQNLWQLERRISDVLQQTGLQPDMLLSSLSGGWLRKASLARALVCSPQVLLLDEPTNHLDIETISWLETFLADFHGSIVFISHDRAFIRSMATRIIDLDRGRLVSWPGNYDRYLAGKEAELRVEEVQNAQFDSKLQQEEVWIRQGIKARRTRNEGRVRALQALRRERSQRREVMGKATMEAGTAARSGKVVFELEQVSYSTAGKTLVNNFSALVQRGDKIALIGPNGSGKTTLLRLMSGELLADSGLVCRGTNLSIAYFDQHRSELDPDDTVMNSLADGKQEVMINGKPRHVLGYLQDFLFHPKRAMTPVRALSGGERNRLLLAKLFLKPSNLLILDEPTNDLDVETLELLEALIGSYQGTVLLVSHDRRFVDNTVTECWIFEGNGDIENFVGGYYDAWQQHENWQQNRKPLPIKAEAALVTREQKSKYESVKSRSNTGKLSYNLQRELEQMPSMLETLEAELARLQSQVNEAGFYRQPHDVTQPVLDALSSSEQALEAAFERWEYLESLRKSG